MSVTLEIAARLLAGPTLFKHVGVATDLAAVLDRPPTVGPAAYVLVTREASAENARMTGPVLQRSERDVTVVIVVSHVGDRVGGAVADPLEDLKAFGRARLVGWLPASMASLVDPITHVEGAIEKAERGWVWFQDTFSAPTYLTQSTDHEPETPEP